MTIRTRAQELLRRREGPLTRDLLRRPGDFGLGQVPERLAPDATTTLVCGFCSTGCGLTAHLRRGEAVNLSAASEYPVNLGMACPKGWEALTPLASPDRATRPLLRGKSGALEPVDWPRAMEAFRQGFRAIQNRHGDGAVAFLSTGQIPTEEMVFLGALAKFGMGWLHGDGNTRQCMATAASAYKESFGFDAPPYTYRDLEQSDVLVLVGSNLCIAHPILWERICRNPHSPEILVLDPRKTETAMAATQHLAIAPRSDLVFFYGLALLLLELGAVDSDFVERHTEGFADFVRFLEAGDFTPARVARETGLSELALRRCARTIADGKRVSFWWTMGVNQGHEAVRVAQAIIDVALMTGSIGRPGTGANSITGQCNAMGSRLFSNTTNLLGGRDFSDASHRGEVARVLGIPAARIPAVDSKAYDEIVEGIRQGEIRGLWVIATNGAHSWIDQNDFRALLDRLDFLVVQDLYPDTETARHAHLVLPAAGWGEKEGTFINSERRLGLLKKVRRAPGQALADFHIFRLVAEAWGCGALFERWKTPEDVFESLRELTRGRPCDVSGIRDYRMLDEAGGIQWPHPEGAPAPETERRLFEDGVFPRPNGRARFCFETPRPVPEAPDAEYPFVLLTGRGSSAQWHTQTRTGRSAVLRKLHPADPVVEIHPEDAERLGIGERAWVELRSRRGVARARAFVASCVQPGQLFLAMHHEETNRLTLRAFDPYSRQPAYKHCAVSIAPLVVRPETRPRSNPARPKG
jgi:assimilatory nitrate reductase catalytic subunit